MRRMQPRRQREPRDGHGRRDTRRPARPPAASATWRHGVSALGTEVTERARRPAVATNARAARAQTTTCATVGGVQTRRLRRRACDAAPTTDDRRPTRRRRSTWRRAIAAPAALAAQTREAVTQTPPRDAQSAHRHHSAHTAPSARLEPVERVCRARISHDARPPRRRAAPPRPAPSPSASIVDQHQLLSRVSALHRLAAAPSVLTQRNRDTTHRTAPHEPRTLRRTPTTPPQRPPSPCTDAIAARLADRPQIRSSRRPPVAPATPGR